MIKKITSIILMIVMLMSLTAVSVHAQNDYPDLDSDGYGISDTMDNVPVSVRDISISSRVVADVQTQTGAEVRVMQLMRNVEANIQGAELILRVAQDCNCPEYDRMSEIVNLLDVIAVELSEFDFSRSSREMAQEIVELRTDAVDLTTQFRELARQVISSEEDREELRELTREVRDNQREEFEQRIEERVRNHQIEQFRELVVRLDIQVDELVRLAVAGEVSIPDARQQLAQILRERNQEERQQALQRVRESQTRENIELRERVREVEEIVRERVQQRDERLEERLIDRVQRVEQRVIDRASPQLFEQVCQSAGGGRSDRASAALFKQVCSGFGGDDSDEVSEEERDRRLQNLRNERLNILNNRIEVVQDRIQQREERPVACTREYMPVCAQPPMPRCPEGMFCPQVMPPLETFGNECMARAVGAQVQYRGECRENTIQDDNLRDIFLQIEGIRGEETIIVVNEDGSLQVQGDRTLLLRYDGFLKIEGIEGESRVNIDNDGFLVIESQNFRSSVDAFLKIEGIDGETPVIVEPKLGGDDRPSESLSFSYGKIKVTYEPQTSPSQGDSQDDLEERCERVQVRSSRDGNIEVLSVCWGSGAQAAKDLNSTRSNRTGGVAYDISDNEEVDDSDRDSSTTVRVDANIRVER